MRERGDSDRDGYRDQQRVTTAILLVLLGLILMPFLICGGVLFLSDFGERRAKQEAADPRNYATVGQRQRIADVEVGLVSAERNRVQRDNGRTTDEHYLLLHIEIVNHSPTRRVTYRTWREFNFGSKTSAFDEHGNSIRPEDRHDPAGAVRWSKDINPGAGPVQDVLVYEVPLKVATTAFFVFDAREIGLIGEFRFKVPASAWDVSRE